MQEAFRVVKWLLLPWALPAAHPGRSDAFAPPALYVTWQRNPATTMTILWQTVDEAKPEVYFRVRSTQGWTNSIGRSHPLPSSIRTIHAVELTGLTPKTDYEFCVWPGERKFAFRTMPATLAEPVRFIIGGDVYHERKWMDARNELAGRFDPAFVVIGGDLVYSCEKALKPEKMERWEAYFDSWKSEARAPAFYALFPLPGPRGYDCLDFGNYLGLFLLDSGITHPTEGAQTAWLKAELTKRRSVPHLVPIYQVPAYPSIRSDVSGESADLTRMIRRSWCPLFEEAGVKVAFENHDHAYKRTHPIRNGKIDSTGIIYLGDGAWGVNLRKPDTGNPRWFIAGSDAIRHFFVVTLYPESRHILAVNDSGQVFDEVYQRTSSPCPMK
jgi:acid phosphatase type 7